jgi:hypothetical protein
MNQTLSARNSCDFLNTEHFKDHGVNVWFECFVQKFTTDLIFFMLCILLTGISLIDIFVNLLVILSILCEKQCRQRVDLCFMSNALADLLMGLVIMPLTAIYTLFGNFPLGNLSCFIWNCLDFTLGTVSMLHIAFISYDRFLCVSKPMSKYKQNALHKTASNCSGSSSNLGLMSRNSSHTSLNRKMRIEKFSLASIPTYLILIFIWVFAASAWIPVILYFKSVDQVIDVYEEHTCSFSTKPSIIIPHSIIVYHVPIFLIILFYTKTILVVNQKLRKKQARKEQQHHQQQQQQKKRHHQLSTINSMPDFDLSNQTNFDLGTDKRKNMTFINIFCSFILCKKNNRMLLPATAAFPAISKSKSSKTKFAIKSSITEDFKTKEKTNENDCDFKLDPKKVRILNVFF